MRPFGKRLLAGAALAALPVASAYAQTPYPPPGARPAPAPAPMQAGGLYPPPAQTAPRPMPSMQQGGLAPPAPFSPATPPVPIGPSPTQATLEEADRRDAGRGLEFVYIAPELGAEYVALEALHGPLLPAAARASALGPLVGAGAGLRLLFFTAGPRVRLLHTGDFDLLTIDLELGWHVPLGSLEPYALLAIGYGRLGGDAIGTSTVDGYNLRIGGGVDYYLTSVVSLGASLGAQLLRLKVHDGPYGLGLGVTGSAVLGLHF